AVRGPARRGGAGGGRSVRGLGRPLVSVRLGLSDSVNPLARLGAGGDIPGPEGAPNAGVLPALVGAAGRAGGAVPAGHRLHPVARAGESVAAAPLERLHGGVRARPTGAGGRVAGRGHLPETDPGVPAALPFGAARLAHARGLYRRDGGGPVRGAGPGVGT